MGRQGSILGGRYRLLDVLGDGGMARVFRAQDERLHRIVAVKILHQQYLGQPEFVRRFEQEAQLAAGLAHPSIVAIYDLGRDEDTYYIVMEYVEGSSLKEVIAREGRLPLDRAIIIARQLGHALDFAHGHGVIHRDIKPENILLTPADQVKVSDFGIARALTSPGQTATGIVLGSVSYFSPEQAQGQPATAESDIYSSAIVLYEMLTGRVPFVADNPLATAMQHITQQPPPPRVLVPALPAAVDGVVLKALHKDPRGRFHSGAALADALAAAVLASPLQPALGAGYGRPAVSPWPHPRAARTRHVSRPAGASPSRHRAPLLSLALLVLVGGGVAYAATQGPHLDVGRFFAGGSPLPRTPTTLSAARTPGAGATKVVAMAGGRATSTLPPPSATPAPFPSSNPTASGPPWPVGGRDLKPISADIVTAARARVAGGRIYVTNPRDTFGPRAGVVFAIFRVHNLPAHAQVGARWTFPDGRRIVYACPASDCPPRRSVSAHYTYWVEQTLAGPGQYAVSALVNGRAIGLHHFSVEAGASAPDQDGQHDQDDQDGQHDQDDQDTPDTTPAMELGVFAAKPVSTRHRRHSWAGLGILPSDALGSTPPRHDS
jgi:predicted Ser/Thr protein kinase